MVDDTLIEERGLQLRDRQHGSNYIKKAYFRDLREKIEIEEEFAQIFGLRKQ
jgi:hypothetical protein